MARLCCPGAVVHRAQQEMNGRAGLQLQSRRQMFQRLLLVADFGKQGTQRWRERPRNPSSDQPRVPALLALPEDCLSAAESDPSGKSLQNGPASLREPALRHSRALPYSLVWKYTSASSNPSSWFAGSCSKADFRKCRLSVRGRRRADRRISRSTGRTACGPAHGRPP